MKINLRQNIQYAYFSKDFNKIHTDKLYSEKFFVKKPICHGTNIVIKVLNKLKIKNIFRLNIIFHNYIKINEEFFFKKVKNKINIYNNEKKITITFINENKLNLKKIKDHLNLISKYVGNYNKKKFPSIILNINLERFFSKKNFKKFSRIKKNIYKLTLQDNNIKSEILFVKLQPRPIIKMKSNRKKTSSKVLIFGKNSDLGIFTANYLRSKGYYVDFYTKYITKLNKINYEFNNIKKYDYVFYFLTSKIVPFKKKYDFENYQIFKKICNYFLKKKVKIFYPSTKFIDYRKTEYIHYIKSKIKSEKFINSLSNKDVRYYRLPQIKSSQTYNLFGNYQGKKINILEKYIDKFIQE